MASIPPGTLVGPYEVAAVLGIGGMGEVYRARDRRLDRDVALKFLPPNVAGDPDRLARFQREARTLASLNHPNIAQVYGLEDADGTPVIAMELVEGQTLDVAIAEGLTTDHALRIARQIAEGLEAAHERGIVHRDLKPANIKITPDGLVKILDFGLAKASDGDASSPPPSAGLTVTSPAMTTVGLILGTAAYMSPEQARGRTVDRRADIWSFGAVLYEMLTGQRAFPGDDITQTLARVVERDPDWSALPRALPPGLVVYLRRCLEKDARQRVQAIGDIRLALDGAFDGTAAAAHERPARAGAAGRMAMAIAVVVALALAGVAAWDWWRPRPSPPAFHASLDVGDIVVFAGERVVVSPDGETLAATGTLDGRRGLFVRAAGEDAFRLLTTVGSPTDAAFSPDSQWIAYRADRDREIMKVAVSGGAPTVVVPASLQLQPVYPHWGDRGSIVFSAGVNAVYMVPADGGSPVKISDEGGILPRLLPGERGVIWSDPFRASTRYLDLDTREVRELLPGAIGATYVDSGHLLYADPAGSLWAVPFDAAGAAITGAPVHLMDGITVSSNAYARFSVSRAGTLVYGVGRPEIQREIVVRQFDGVERVLPLSPRSLLQLRWSPDGRSLAFVGGERLWSGLYVYDAELGSAPRLLSAGDASARHVAWSPDGSRLVLSSYGAGTSLLDLFVVPVRGGTPPARVLEHALQANPWSWARNDTVLFSLGTPRPFELWTLQVSDPASAQPYLTSEESLDHAALSPDGRLVAYVASGDGSSRVHVQTFPVPGAPLAISSDRGLAPRWSPDGSRLYYWEAAADESATLFAATLQRDPAPGVRSTREVLGGYDARDVPTWDVHPDGLRFGIARRVRSADGEQAEGAARFRVVVNWSEEFRTALAGAGR